MKITLCGSTRFKSAFNDWNAILTRAGHVVYSIAMSDQSGAVADERLKSRLDSIHKLKIDESELVVVLNERDWQSYDGSGYIGPSTRSEIDWAALRDIPVVYLNPDGGTQMGVDSLTNVFEGHSPLKDYVEVVRMADDKGNTPFRYFWKEGK